MNILPIVMPALAVVVELAIIAWKPHGGTREMGLGVSQGRRPPPPSPGTPQ